MEKLIEEVKAAGLAEKGFGDGPIGGYLMQQHPGEFAALVQALLDWEAAKNYKIESYLQVGSAAGGAERFLCERLGGLEHLAIIDMGDHPQFSTWRNQNRPAIENCGIYVEEHIGDSHDEAAADFMIHLGKFDLIGIDGDHTPAGVRMDWELITPALRPGSLVWFHDINHSFMRTRDNGPWEVWSKLKTRHKVHLEIMERFGIGLLEIV